MRIGSGPNTMKALMDGQNMVSIPSFQRNFAWTADQIDEFLADVYNSADEGKSHFWGPVVFLRTDDDSNLYQVIDGQQRVTTTVIFISLLRDVAWSLEDKMLNKGLANAMDIHSIIRNSMFLSNLYVKPRFSASYLIEEIFRERVISDPVGGLKPREALTVRGAGMDTQDRVNTRDLRRAYIRIKNSLHKRLKDMNEDQKKVELLRLFSAATELFEIHSMELSNEDDAYILFETLNQRGLKLNPSDLLKTLTLKTIRSKHGATELQKALDTWDQCVENIGESDFTKFLRHYLLTEGDTKVQATRILETFKARIEELDKTDNDGAAKNLLQIRRSSEVYGKLLNNSQYEDADLQSSIIRMNSFSDTHRVFMLGMLTSEVGVELRLPLTRAIERLAFRWIATGGNAQELENFYQRTARSLRKDSSNANAQHVLAEILAHAPNDENMAALALSDGVNLQKYVLRRIEESTGGKTLKWTEPISLEHLAPQNPTASSAHWSTYVAEREPSDDELGYDQFVRMWGNLTLLESQLNSSISNSEWPAKVAGDDSKKYKGLSASTMNLNQKIRNCENWTRDLILQRTNWILRTALMITSENWAVDGKAKVEMWDPTEEYVAPFVESEDAED
jgi:hypothetical protein